MVKGDPLGPYGCRSCVGVGSVWGVGVFRSVGVLMGECGGHCVWGVYVGWWGVWVCVLSEFKTN